MYCVSGIRHSTTEALNGEEDFILKMLVSATASVQRKRRRPALACDRCRRRKIKCDRRPSCSHCVRTGFGSSCTYVSGDQVGATVARDHDESIKDYSSNSQHSGYDDGHMSPTFSIGSSPAENELHESFWDVCALPEGEACWQGPKEPVGLVIDHSDGSGGAQALQQRVRQLEQKLASVNKAQASKNTQASAASQDDERVKGTIWQSSLLGRSHWSSSVNNVRLDPFL